MGSRLFAAGVAEQGRAWRQCQHFAEFHLRFVPLENKHALRLQNAETFREAKAQIFAPVRAELPVFRRQPAFCPGPDKVRRVKDHQAECTVRERQLAEIHPHIRVNVNDAFPIRMPMRTIRHNYGFVAAITKQDCRILAVKPHHAGAATGIKNARLRHGRTLRLFDFPRRLEFSPSISHSGNRPSACRSHDSDADS